LVKTSALAREMGGVVGILCKSGKDRTSMSTTLDITRALIENVGVLQNGKVICDTLRGVGCRRANVFANTGSNMYAFNVFQWASLPICYRPPPSSFAGNVQS